MNDNKLVFKPEDPSFPKENILVDKPAWKILIVDDEPEIHTTTKLVLGDFEFEGSGLKFISAYSGAQALEMMKIHDDICVILLDVVMETIHSGLDCARTIREELKNKLVRIILRTGQPGQAPERKVIIDYDINDYKQKTELTSQRLFTTIYTAIRSYRDMQAIEKNRTGLRYIIEASGDFFKQQSIRKLAKGVLTQIAALFRLQNSLYLTCEGFTLAQDSKGGFKFIAATGKFEKKNKPDESVILDQVLDTKFKQVVKNKKSAYFGNDFVGYFPTQKKEHHILYMENCGKKENQEYRDLLDIFTHNVGIAFDNVYLNQEIQETQQEIIHLLGEVVESRSKETAFHVIRVAEYIEIIGKTAGVDLKQLALIKSASPMHDVGKIGISDAILLKPDKLTPDEIEIMQTHTEIGYKILSSSKRRLLQMAATIAYSHHEHWNGQGYPSGLKAQTIPLAGRLTCLADVFDALSSQRVYKKAWPLDRVLDFLKHEKGKIFDPSLVEAFFACKEKILEIQVQYADKI